MVDRIIYVSGHTGLAGSAIVRELYRRGYNNLLLKTHKELDLRNSEDVEYFMRKHHPHAVFLAAAHAGGIMEAIRNPAWMLLDNLEIITNVIRASFLINVHKLIFLASSCVYPINAPQPYKEEYLGTGRTDENWSYAIAKLAGIELCNAFNSQYDCNYVTIVPCNLYGINDNFDLNHAHVIPALIRKFHENDQVEVWGDGTAEREFLYADDFGRAAVDVYEQFNKGVINIGSGYQVTISQLVNIVSSIVSNGNRTITYNPRYPNGVKSKLLDITKITSLGWQPTTSLTDGIKRTYDHYLSSYH